MEKRITFDTNIFLHNIGEIVDSKYDAYQRISLIPVISELDNIKTNSTKLDLKYKGRIATRKLVEFIQQGIVKPIYSDNIENLLSLNKYEVVDDTIISICKKEDIELVTMDLNVFLKCKHLNVICHLIEKENKVKNLSSIYKGKVNLYVSSNIVDKVKKGGEICLQTLQLETEIFENACVTLIDEINYAHKAYTINKSGVLKSVYVSKDENYYGFKPVTEEQIYATKLLTDDNINIISITGEAGTGKTFISFAVGLEQKINSSLSKGKLFIARPPVSLSRKLMLGFKKGDVLEKAMSTLGCYTSNLERLSELKGGSKITEIRKGGSYDGKDMLFTMLEQLNLEYLNLEDILGMSFGKDDYIIIDEAEQLNEDEMKAILTRGGGKVIIIGDCDQTSDNANVDFDNSGLLHLIEVGKNSKSIAHITLEEVHRSGAVAEINKIW